MAHWSETDIPPLNGRRALVTGGSSGTGFETALMLARHGASVTLTSREADRGATAVAAIRQRAPDARIDAATLDLADLASVRACAQAIASIGPLDLLINNAGVMAPPARAATQDGFELQFGTNHLGHFALTGLLLPALNAAPAARVVTVSSIAHRRGEIHFGDLNFERRYKAMQAYAQSKLANLMFARELQTRLAASGARTISIAAHPGVARTGLFHTMFAGSGALIEAAGPFVIGLASHSASRGALPIVMAATNPSLIGGEYLGPTGFREMRGPPGPAHPAPQATDTAATAELWRRSEALTGVRYLG